MRSSAIAAYDESRELGASYVGPEHVLLALGARRREQAGQLLQRFGVSHTKLRGAVIRGVEAGGRTRETSKTPTLDQYGRDLTQMARRGQARSCDRPRRRDRADDRGSLAANEENRL